MRANAPNNENLNEKKNFTPSCNYYSLPVEEQKNALAYDTRA